MVPRVNGPTQLMALGRFGKAMKEKRGGGGIITNCEQKFFEGARDVAREARGWQIEKFENH